MVNLITLPVPDIDVNQLISLREAQLAYRLSDEVVPKKIIIILLHIPVEIPFSPRKRR